MVSILVYIAAGGLVLFLSGLINEKQRMRARTEHYKRVAWRMKYQNQMAIGHNKMVRMADKVTERTAPMLLLYVDNFDRMAAALDRQPRYDTGLIRETVRRRLFILSK